ncbi:MAG: YgjV family protein [Clostridia bacterium]|nr:YgjV family protein [Clostridia bacterium]
MTEIIYEIIGYIGTALVLFSMMMTSVVKLRLVNILGSLFSMTYALLAGAYPVALLNAGLIIINLFQLIRYKMHRRSFKALRVSQNDESFKYFMSLFDENIKKFFPSFSLNVTDKTQIYMIYDQSEAVGVLTAEVDGKIAVISLDYTTPKYRDTSVAKFLFSYLKKNGIKQFETPYGTPEHNKYLMKMGFEPHDGKMIKTK